MEVSVDRLPKLLLGIVAASAMLLFLGGVLLAARYSIWTDPPTPDKMPTIATYVVSTMNGILVANLGAILGVSAFRGSFGQTLNQLEKLQWTAAIYYVLMIISVVVIWGR